mmetsp:Transcript_7781/g.20581  ORF Transcript_7781/g.20581 Transcript_7781/m.20581 type:complete len:359 (-) Transcript_7781:794-1870(-)
MGSATRRRARRAAADDFEADTDADGTLAADDAAFAARSVFFGRLYGVASKLGRWNIARVVTALAVLLVVALQLKSDAEKSDLWTADASNAQDSSNFNSEEFVAETDEQVLRRRREARKRREKSVEAVDPFIVTDNSAILEIGRSAIAGAEFPQTWHEDNGTAVAEIIAGVVIKQLVYTVVDLSCRDSFELLLKLHPILLARRPEYVYKCVDPSLTHVRRMFNTVKELGLPNWFFYRREFSGEESKPLPRADLVIALDALQKHGLDGIGDILASIRDRKVELLLLTTNPNRRNPLKGRQWKYARMDFHSAPFNLPAPMFAFSEGISLNASHPTMPKRIELLPVNGVVLTSAINAIKAES